MKNIKLLLATTAMLSMGAMVANATGVVLDTATLNVKMYVVETASLINGDTLDFGLIDHHPKGASISMDHNTGELTASGGATFYPGAQQRGSVVVDAFKDDISGIGKYGAVSVKFPEYIRLGYGSDGYCGYVDGFNDTTLTPEMFNGSNVTISTGGTLHFADNGTDTYALNFDGQKCTGEGEITLILTTE